MIPLYVSSPEPTLIVPSPWPLNGPIWIPRFGSSEKVPVLDSVPLSSTSWPWVNVPGAVPSWLSAEMARIPPVIDVAPEYVFPELERVRVPAPVLASPPVPPIALEIRVLPAPAMVVRYPALVMVPPRVRVPDWLVKIRAEPSVVARFQVLLPVLVRSPLRVTALPPMANPPVVKVTAPSVASQLLVLVWRVDPLNTSVSPLAGVAPFQLPAVLQLVSPPPPFQVMVAAGPDRVPKALSSQNGRVCKVCRLNRIFIVLYVRFGGGCGAAAA